MELYLQMGHGMQKVAEDYLKLVGEGTIILSPMNTQRSSIEGFSQKVKDLNGQIMLDPQIFFPDKYHKNLVKYEYFPKKGELSVKNGNIDSVISKLIELNDRIGSKEIILPSISTTKIDSSWNNLQNAIVESVKKKSKERRVILTISLCDNVVNDIEQIEQIISFAEQWDVNGVYIVCEHPNRYYLVDNPLWVSNIMSLSAGLKRQKKKVIVGYSSHQMLCLSLTKCDAIASGSFLNLRWFQSEHFASDTEKGPSRRATWYYCPQALSEYKIPFLDVASRLGLIDRLRPSADFANEYSEMLFKTARPSLAEFKEKHAFRHYLYCLQMQCRRAVKPSYKLTRDSQIVMLRTARQLLDGLNSMDIKGGERDFSELIDVNLAAISTFEAEYSYTISNEWDEL